MRILLAPIITEKALSRVSESVYVFRVDKHSNKPEIAKMIEEMYKVKVEKVNVINLKSETKLIRGRFPGKKKAFKKAIIVLKKGQKIPGFEEK